MDSKKILILPGDVCKLTFRAKTPVYVNITFEEVPQADRVLEEEIVVKL